MNTGMGVLLSVGAGGELEEQKGGAPQDLHPEGAPQVPQGCYWAGASSAGSTSGTQSCAPALVDLVSFAVAHRSEAATSSASISTAVRLAPSSVSQGVALICAR